MLKKNATHGKVIESLKGLMAIVDVLIMDKEIILNALNSLFTDFEDALQSFSAVKSMNVDFIITRNPKDYKHSSLPVFTPQSYIKNRLSGVQANRSS